jgi:hypothetical protein
MHGKEIEDAEALAKTAKIIKQAIVGISAD